ncbi:hypothetical protein J5N97_028339 [Dioscorea zingiberensis]|uniref:Uncharacterized protein n=1 Tax=Dioscorea zingiberensis TaxID=325984 RepID=A0A9D5BYB1_9LILI|nr:hypothetical protein J5N97_028339 [Dioscorea zingiberensis]
METEMHQLAPSPSARLVIHRAATASASEDDAGYTSLKDIIVAAPASHPRDSAGRDATLQELYGFGFDSASIPIRNQLLKHAASAYLQSAAIIASRNQSLFSRIWRRIRRLVAEVRSGWRRCARRAVQVWRGVVRGVVECLPGIVGGA